jgi:hypothetical protein
MKEAPAIKRWRTAGSPTRGPLAFPSPGVALKQWVAARSLSRAAPAGLAPLVLLTEVDGTPLYLHVVSGKVLSLHHDASLSEAAAEAAATSETPEAFAKALVDRGSGFGLEAVLQLGRTVEEWKAWRPRGLAPTQRAKILCEGLGLTPRKLASRLRAEPTVFEWLGLEPATLDELADGLVRTAPVAGSSASTGGLASPEVVETLAAAKQSARALDLKAPLTRAEAARLSRFNQLEVLVARLESGAKLPSTLVQLRALTVFGGGEVPALPRLERLTAWAPATLPRALPALVELSWQPADETLAAGLKAISSYRSLRNLSLFNAWPVGKAVPVALKKLTQLTSLHLVNTVWARDVAGIAALRKTLKHCDVQVR